MCTGLLCTDVLLNCRSQPGKHTDLRPWAPCLAPCVARLLLLLLLCLASSYFHAVFPLCCFPVCLHPASARSPHSHCSASGGSKTRFFFFFFKDNVFELCGSREEHQKRYAAFNHANLDHFLLTAWHLFKVIMLNRLFTRNHIQACLKRGSTI